MSKHTHVWVWLPRIEWRMSVDRQGFVAHLAVGSVTASKSLHLPDNVIRRQARQ